MTKARRRKLEAKGYWVGDAYDFCNFSESERKAAEELKAKIARGEFDMKTQSIGAFFKARKPSSAPPQTYRQD